MAKKAKKPVNFLSEIEVNVDGDIQTVDVEEQIEIDSNDIQKSFADQPAKYAWWAVLTARARNEADIAKSTWETAEDNLKKTITAQLYQQCREALELEGKKPTEAMVNNSVYTHKKYLDAVDGVTVLHDEYLDKQLGYAELDAIREAFYHRKDMVISLGAQLRAETDYGN